MKTFEEIFKKVKIENKKLNENIQTDIKVFFKGNKEYEKLKKNAKKDQDKIPEFFDYVYNIIGDVEIDKLSKKYKIDYDKLAKEFLK